MTTLTTTTVAQVLSFAAEGVAQFEWNSEDPLAINLTIDLPFLGAVQVQFARELLDQAFTLPGKAAGIGDVIVEEIEWNSPSIPLRGMARDLANQKMPVLRFLLARDNGPHVGVLVPQSPVIDLMVRSFMHVPAKTEKLGVDAAIESILAGGAR